MLLRSRQGDQSLSGSRQGHQSGPRSREGHWSPSRFHQCHQASSRSHQDHRSDAAEIKERLDDITYNNLQVNKSLINSRSPLNSMDDDQRRHHIVPKSKDDLTSFGTDRRTICRHKQENLQRSRSLKRRQNVSFRIETRSEDDRIKNRPRSRSRSCLRNLSKGHSLTVDKRASRNRRESSKSYRRSKQERSDKHKHSIGRRSELDGKKMQHLSSFASGKHCENSARNYSDIIVDRSNSRSRSTSKKYFQQHLRSHKCSESHQRDHCKSRSFNYIKLHLRSPTGSDGDRQAKQSYSDHRNEWLSNNYRIRNNQRSSSIQNFSKVERRSRSASGCLQLSPDGRRSQNQFPSHHHRRRFESDPSQSDAYQIRSRRRSRTYNQPRHSSPSQKRSDSQCHENWQKSRELSHSRQISRTGIEEHIGTCPCDHCRKQSRSQQHSRRELFLTEHSQSDAEQDGRSRTDNQPGHSSKSKNRSDNCQLGHSARSHKNSDGHQLRHSLRERKRSDNCCLGHSSRSHNSSDSHQLGHSSRSHKRSDSCQLRHSSSSWKRSDSYQLESSTRSQKRSNSRELRHSSKFRSRSQSHSRGKHLKRSRSHSHRRGKHLKQNRSQSRSRRRDFSSVENQSDENQLGSRRATSIMHYQLGHSSRSQERSSSIHCHSIHCQRPTCQKPQFSSKGRSCIKESCDKNCHFSNKHDCDCKNFTSNAEQHYGRDHRNTTAAQGHADIQTLLR